MDIEIISNFKNKINHLINDVNQIIVERSSKIINFQDILFLYCLKIGNDDSFDAVNAKLKIKNIIDVSKNALIKSVNKLDPTHISYINSNLLDYVFDSDKKRYIIVDGSHLILLKDLNKDNFRLSDDGNYCTCLLSALIDMETEIPISYEISKDTNERKCLMNQLKFLKKTMY